MGKTKCAHQPRSFSLLLACLVALPSSRSLSAGSILFFFDSPGSSGQARGRRVTLQAQRGPTKHIKIVSPFEARYSELMKFASLFLTLTLLLLTACAHLPVSRENHYRAPADRQAQLAAISHWEIQGVFSLNQPGQAVVANYNWLQSKAGYELRIHSALNLYTVLIKGNAQQVQLWRGDTLIANAKRPEELMLQQLGWELPVSNLQYWVRSLPAPGPYKAHWDSWGRLSVLEQAGWKVAYQNYQSHQRSDFPTLIQLSRDNWHSKILIKRWEFL